MKGTPLTEQTYNYIVEHFAAEEAMLLELMQKRAIEAGVPIVSSDNSIPKMLATSACIMVRMISTMLRRVGALSPGRATT